MTDIRKERTVGVTTQISVRAATNLWVLANSETWKDVLDTLEQCCIEVETQLINTPVENSIAVLENHKLSKAAWMMFETFQNKVIDAGNYYLSRVATQPVAPQKSPEEQEREYTLNPTNYPTLSDEEIAKLTE